MVLLRFGLKWIGIERRGLGWRRKGRGRLVEEEEEEVVEEGRVLLSERRLSVRTGLARSKEGG